MKKAKRMTASIFSADIEWSSTVALFIAVSMFVITQAQFFSINLKHYKQVDTVIEF